MNYKRIFNNIDKRFNLEIHSVYWRKKQFFKKVKRNKKTEKIYQSLVNSKHKSKWISKNKTKHKNYCLKYQKNEKYRQYRREYEKHYRTLNRDKHNFKSMKSKYLSTYPKKVALQKIKRYLDKKSK